MKKEFKSNGTVCYKNEEGKYHREDGPVIIYADGTEEYLINGDFREDKEIDLVARRKTMVNTIQYLEFTFNIITA